jgi:hypothetical protein
MPVTGATADLGLCQRAQIDPFGEASKVMGTAYHNVPNGGSHLC